MGGWCFPGGQSVGWRAIPTRRPAATQGQGGTVPPPPPPPLEPPFLVQARSTPVAPHTFTKTYVLPTSQKWFSRNIPNIHNVVLSLESLPPFSLPPTSLSWESD